jgi:hypothetical protein
LLRVGKRNGSRSQARSQLVKHAGASGITGLGEFCRTRRDQIGGQISGGGLGSDDTAQAGEEQQEAQHGSILGRPIQRDYEGVGY